MAAPAERLANISDTALWVAAYRAEESERPDALFHDPFARRLAGERGFRLLDGMPKGRQTAWPMVVRTVLMDRMVLVAVDRGADLVLNLAAGLDARPYRLALPATLRWVEVDLPGMIDNKSAILAAERPVCRLERIAADLSDGAVRRSLLADLARGAGRALVITEGLLIYLDEVGVAALADELAAAGRYREWIADLVSPGLLRRLQSTWGKEVGAAGAPFRFAPEKGPEFFADHGWRVAEIHGSFHAAARLKRLPWFLSLIAKIFPDPKDWKPRRVWGGVVRFERP